MNEKLGIVAQKFLVYADEVERGYNGLARLHKWIFGEQYNITTRQGNVLSKKVDTVEKCLAPSFFNAAKSIQYMHKMSYVVMFELIPFIFNSNIEDFLDEDEQRTLKSLSDDQAKINYKRRFNNRRNKWLETIDVSRNWCQLVFSITSDLEKEFTKTINVKFGTPMNDDDIKRYLKQKKLDCEEDEV